MIPALAVMLVSFQIAGSRQLICDVHTGFSVGSGHVPSDVLRAALVHFVLGSWSLHLIRDESNPDGPRWGNDWHR